MFVDLIRIGHKLIDRNRIIRRIDELLRLREAGKSQQESANALGVDRTFVSRVEALGEVRKGDKVALVGFPIKNKEELEQAARDAGVDYVLVFTEQERRHFTHQTSGADLVNELMQITAELKSFDVVVFLGSDMRIKLVEAMIGKEAVIGIEIGRSPIQEDVWIDIEPLLATLRNLTQKR